MEEEEFRPKPGREREKEVQRTVPRQKKKPAKIETGSKSDSNA